MTKLIAAFPNFATAAKNSCYLVLMARSNQPRFNDKRVILQAACLKIIYCYGSTSLLIVDSVIGIWQ